MFLKCRPSRELQSGQRTANGLFGEKGEDGRGVEEDGGLAELREQFQGAVIICSEHWMHSSYQKVYLLINHNDRKLNVLLCSESSKNPS